MTPEAADYLDKGCDDLDDARKVVTKTFSIFLARAYEYKEIADYGIGHGAVVTMAEADDAIRNAARFVDYITALLAEGPPKDTR